MKLRRSKSDTQAAFLFIQPEGHECARSRIRTDAGDLTDDRRHHDLASKACPLEELARARRSPGSILLGRSSGKSEAVVMNGLLCLTLLAFAGPGSRRSVGGTSGGWLSGPASRRDQESD
jgi:hypothetical protein